MSSVKGGLVILKEMVNTLPPSEGKIAQYIIDYPQEAILLTALQLGENSKTSSAAVIRLCKSLGFNGFQELKIRVAGDLQDRYLEGYRDIHPNEDYQDRKSTRLNSSHVAISYAVFCLKIQRK